MLHSLSVTIAHLCAVVFIALGLDKVRSPQRTRNALFAAGLPARLATDTTVRGLGVVETVAGLALIITGHPFVLIAVGAMSLAFAVMVERARRSGAADCGCLGSTASPPDRLHVAINLVFAASCFVAAAFDSNPVDAKGVLADQPFAGAPYAVTLVTAAWLVIHILGTYIPTRHLIIREGTRS